MSVEPRGSSISDRAVGIVLGVALLLGLGAVAAFAFGVLPLGGPLTPPATSAAASDPASSTPTTTAPPTELESGPASRHGLECESLVDAALVSDLFNRDLEPADPVVTAAGIGIAIPRVTSVLSVGGTVCEWSNGEAYNSQYGHAPEYTGVTVSIVPRPAAGWSERAVSHGMPGEWSECIELATCSSSTAAGDAWVTVVASGGPSVINTSAWPSLVDAVVAAVSTAGPAAPPTFTEHSDVTTAEDCEAILPRADVESITGEPDAVPRAAGGGGWSEWAEARLIAGDLGCLWTVGDTDTSVASVDWVNDGRWAYERMLRADTTSPVELLGLAADDAAVIRCSEEPYGDSCAVDLRIGQDWYNVGAADRATAIALAEAILAQLQP